MRGGEGGPKKNNEGSGSPQENLRRNLQWSRRGKQQTSRRFASKRRHLRERSFFSLDPVPVKVKTRERRPADGESLAGQDEVGETPGTVVDDAPACQGRQPHPEVVHAEPPQEHGGIRVLGEASGGCFLPEPFCTRGARQLCCWGEGGAANRGAPHSAGKVHSHTASR